MHIYGSKISYYTGKLESYLRYRDIQYDFSPTVGSEKKLLAGAGTVQMPVVQLDDGRWMTDSTPMIAWLESEQNAPSVYPLDPALRFIALLIEDYADEWLWRPAMHYRWSYRPDRRYASESLYNELIAGNKPIPRFIALRLLSHRQFNYFVRGDGVTPETRAHVDGTYLTALARLQAIFEGRPFVLGNSPTIADFGLVGPMLRHFSQDPTPAELMRTHAPAVYEWVARMWNLQVVHDESQLIEDIDDALVNLLTEICETHLSQLRQNANAYRDNLTRYDQDIQGCHYAQVPTSRYRVWCLEELRRAWRQLDHIQHQNLRSALTSPDATILWEDVPLSPSNYDMEREAPFNRAINVFGTGVPPR